jgi:O-acetyl-ADP-ribose deacetylase (regulator of RNase III)
MKGGDLIFVSLNPTFVELARAAFPNATVCSEDVATLETKGTAFVSPANSLGFMDGGIDAAYRRMFPGCESIVKHMIRAIGQLTNLGRPYLRVGSVLWQPLQPQGRVSRPFHPQSRISRPFHPQSRISRPLQPIGAYLITAPTMFLPHDVSHTQNAYWAMRSVLMAFDRIRIGSPQTTRLVVPSLCCGWGGMRPADSVTQIARAIVDHKEEGPLPIDVEGLNYFLLPSRDHEQPPNFDNREIGVPWPTQAVSEEKEIVWRS